MGVEAPHHPGRRRRPDAAKGLCARGAAQGRAGNGPPLPRHQGRPAGRRLLASGLCSNYGSGRRANFVYVTAIQAGAALAAELAHGPGEGRVYLVEPTGPLEDDPNVTDRKFPGNPSRSYRTREPVRIVGEVQDWERLPPQVLEKLRERMREAARLGVEAIND